jgi:hypothetical protein
MQEGRLESEALLDLRHASFRLGGATLVVGTVFGCTLASMVINDLRKK